MLANLSDFDAANDTLPVEDWLEIDRYAVALTAQLQTEIRAHYDAYEFHFIAQKLQAFCSEDLGGFYLDILKDRLYTSGADSRARRSAQNALFHISHALVRWMAPILSFTAEEVWGELGDGLEDSVFFQKWHTLTASDDALLARWARIRELRSTVLKELETRRAAGVIGSSLQAAVTLHAAPDTHALLASLGDDLRFVLIVSQCTLLAGEADRIDVAPAPGTKCERCWHVREDVGVDPAQPGLCGRCVSNLQGPGEVRSHA